MSIEEITMAPGKPYWKNDEVKRMLESTFNTDITAHITVNGNNVEINASIPDRHQPDTALQRKIVIPKSEVKELLQKLYIE